MIMCKNSDNPVKKLVTNLLMDKSFSNHKIITPLHQIKQAHNRLNIEYLTTQVNINNRPARNAVCTLYPNQVESQMIENISEIFHNKMQPPSNLNSDLGNSNNRTRTQKEQAEMEIQHLPLNSQIRHNCLYQRLITTKSRTMWCRSLNTMEWKQQCANKTIPGSLT